MRKVKLETGRLSLSEDRCWKAARQYGEKHLLKGMGYVVREYAPSYQGEHISCLHIHAYGSSLAGYVRGPVGGRPYQARLEFVVMKDDRLELESLS